jgi:hypothetical protein
MIYGNFISAEVHLISTDFEFVLKNPFITLKNTDDFISSIIGSGLSPSHNDFSALNHGIDGLGWELFDLFKWYQRGNQELVVSHLEKLFFALKKS